MIKLFDVLKIKLSDIDKTSDVYKLNISVENQDKFLIKQQNTPLFEQIKLIRGYESPRINELIFVEAKHNKKKQDQLVKLLTNGFYFNSKHFVRFGKSNSQAKDGITVFVDSEYYEELLERSQLGISIDECVISKYESYRCLIFSSCQFVYGKLPNIVIVDEFKKVLPNQYIRYVVERDVEVFDKNSKQKKTYKNQKFIEEGYKDIKLLPFDGFGVHTKRMSEYFNKFIEKDNYTPIGYQVRLPVLKGMSVEAPIEDFCKDNGISEIKDIFGKWHKVSEIDCIWNISMWKGYDIFYKRFGNRAWEEYISRINKYGYNLGISKYSHHTDNIDVYRRMNFQYLQCLDLYNPKYVEHYKNKTKKYNILDHNNWGKIINIAKYSTDLLEKIIKGDKLYTLKFLGINNSDVNNVNSKYVEAILINDIMLQDPCIRNMLKNKLDKTIRQMKFGKIYTEGFYHTIVGDIIGYLEYCTGLEVKGCLNSGEFYANTIPYGKCISFRSPLVDPSEVNEVNIVHNGLTDKYLDYFKNQDVCMINMYDLSAPQQGGMDEDGDAVYLCHNEIVKQSKINKPIIVDIDDKKTSQVQKYNKENLVKYELNSRDNRIGEITNIATSILNSYTEDELWKKINANNVSLLRLYQGKEIDFLKTGFRWIITKNLRKYLKKLPYFLLHNYPQKLKVYFKLRNINKNQKQEDKIEYNAYHSPSPMNELCEYINQWEKKNLMWDRKVINTGYLLVNSIFDLSNKNIRKNIKTICNEYSIEFKEEIKKKEPQLDILFDKYRSRINEIKIDYELLANYCIDVSYSSINADKLLCWALFSDIILKNLRINSGIIKKCEIVQCDAYDDNAKEFLGKYYKIIDQEGLFVSK